MERIDFDQLMLSEGLYYVFALDGGCALRTHDCHGGVGSMKKSIWRRLTGFYSERRTVF